MKCSPKFPLGTGCGGGILIILHRHYHLKRWDADVEHFFAVEIFHQVSAVHTAHFGAQVAAAYILIIFAGLQGWLYTHYTFAFHFAVTAIAIKNIPVAAVQFYGE